MCTCPICLITSLETCRDELLSVKDDSCVELCSHFAASVYTRVSQCEMSLVTRNMFKVSQIS